MGYSSFPKPTPVQQSCQQRVPSARTSVSLTANSASTSGRLHPLRTRPELTATAHRARSGAEPPALQPGPGPRTPSATPAPSRPDPTAAPTRASGRGSLFYFLFFFLFFFPPPVGNIAFNYDNKSKETSGARIITSEEARCNRRCRYPARGGRDAATPPPDATRSAPGRATCAPPLSDWPRPQTRETTPTRRCDPAPSLLAPPPSGCDHAPPALLAEGAVGGSGARGEGGLRCGWERKGAGLPCCPVPFKQGGGVLLLGKQV